MGSLKAKFKNFRFKGTLMIVLIFALIATILFVELSGVRYRYTQKELTLLPKEKIVTKTVALNSIKKDTLLLYSSNDMASMNALVQFEVILADMKYGTNTLDLANEEINGIENYSIIILKTDFFVKPFFNIPFSVVLSADFCVFYEIEVGFIRISLFTSVFSSKNG